MTVDGSPLTTVPEARIVTVAMGFGETAEIPFGFGYLAPEQEKRFAMGALFSTHMFPGRAPKGHMLLEALIGGRRHPEKLKLDDDVLVRETYADLKKLIHLPDPPVFTKMLRPDHGIPQLRPRQLWPGTGIFQRDSPQRRCLDPELTVTSCSRMNDKLHLWLALRHAPGLGIATARKLLDHFGTIDALFAGSGELAGLGVERRAIAFLRQPDASVYAQDLDWADTPGHHLLCFDEKFRFFFHHLLCFSEGCCFRLGLFFC